MTLLGQLGCPGIIPDTAEGAICNAVCSSGILPAIKQHISMVYVLKFQTLFSFCFQTKCWLSRLEFTKCLSEYKQGRLWMWSDRSLKKQDQTLLWTCVAGAYRCVNSRYAKFKYTGMKSDYTKLHNV